MRDYPWFIWIVCSFASASEHHSLAARLQMEKETMTPNEQSQLS
jgi:hypothetical protein